MKNYFRLLFSGAFLFVISINNNAADSTLFVAGPDTFVLDMKQPGKTGELFHNGTVYLFPGVASSTDLYVKLGPNDEAGATYKVLQSPDMNTFVAYIRKVDMQGRWGFQKTISSVNYNAYFNVMRPDSMKKTPKLSGGTSICSNNGKYTISIDSVKNATRFKWFVSPDSAGHISDTDTVATLIPAINYSGKIKIRVLAQFIDEFGNELTPSLSNPVELTIVSGSQSGFDVATGASHYKMDFTNTSVNADSYDLDYGDASTHLTGAAFTTQTHSYSAAGNYTVTLITQKGSCKDTLAKLVKVWVISLNGSDNSISVFPNPASDRVQIVMEETAGEINFSLLTLNGMVLQKGIFKTSNTTIDISNLATGTYLLQIDTRTYKIVKE